MAMKQSKADEEEAYWQALVNRDDTYEGRVWWAVVTTGIYCRPGCPARLPKRENVRFFKAREAAQKAGFRPCKRCRPDQPPQNVRHGQAVAAAVARIEAGVSRAEDKQPDLVQIAAAAGFSPYYLHRIFKRQLGVTPKQYGDACRAGRLSQLLSKGERVTEAVYAAGYGAPSRVYETAMARHGMRPGQISKKGENMEIRYQIADSWLGRTLVAATNKGVCCIQFGDSDDELVQELTRRFPKARLEAAEKESDYARWILETLAAIEVPEITHTLSLDIQGTAFQEQVWRALMAIPAGRTVTYSDLAMAIGKPKAVRAVAAACGANKLAVVIPCHRVIGKNGSLTGFRWGVARKQQLLDREIPNLLSKK